MSWTSMKANKGGEGGVKAPPGNHLAVLVGIFDMGTQDVSYQGEAKQQHRAYFCWELVGEKIAGTNKNHVIGIDLAMSLNEKAKLRKWIEARTGKPILDGTEFDILSELGQPCFLNIIEKNGYPRIDGVAAVPRGIAVPKPFYPPTAISLDQYRSGTELPEWTPWLFGSPLEDHIDACEELGGEKPTPRKGSTESESKAARSTSPTGGHQHASNLEARWDFSNGTSVERNKTSAEVQDFFNATRTPLASIRVKPAGAPNETAKTADQWGFVPGEVIPF